MSDPHPPPPAEGGSGAAAAAEALAELERRGLPSEALRALRDLPADRLAAVLPSLLEAVELEVRPLGPTDADAVAREPTRFGFLEADVAAELAERAAWNVGAGPVAVGAFDAARKEEQQQLAGFVVARVQVTVADAARALAAAAADPRAAAPLLRRALGSASGPVACIALLGVDYSLRGQGVGSALLDAVENVAAAVAAEMAARGTTAKQRRGRNGGGAAAAPGATVALLAPEEEEDGGADARPAAPARFYARRGYMRAAGGEEKEELARALAGGGDEDGGGEPGRRRRRPRRFGLWVKRVGGDVEDDEQVAPAAAAGATSDQQRRRRRRPAGGGGGGGFATAAIVSRGRPSDWAGASPSGRLFAPARALRPSARSIAAAASSPGRQALGGAF